MRKLSKALSLILAVVIAISNLPPLEASAVTTAPINPQPQSNGMRLRQTDFNEETGILTMSLEVKPSLTGNVWVDSDGYSNYEGRFINEAYLAFQVDPLSVEPITADGTAINAGYGRIGFVGIAREQLDQYEEGSTFGNIALRKKFVHGREGMGIQYGQGFNKSMGTVRTNESGQPTDTFNELFSGYYTSYNREATGLMDCYLHLKWETDVVDCNSEEVTGTDLEGNPLEPGYVKAIDLYFQCYSGDVDSSGERTKAHSVDALFCNSIRLPRDVDTDSLVASSGMTKAEMQELIDQFYVYNKENLGEKEQQYIAVGAAGICERERDPIWGTPTKYYDYYAYDIEPRDLAWQAGTTRTTSVPMDTEPTLSYENKDKKFIVLQFDAQIENTYKFGDAYAAADKEDFFVPTEAGKGEFPRYTIPHMSEMTGLESAEATNGMWMPKAHFFQDAKYVPLKYHLTTYVSASSTTKPETEEGGMDAFLESINWKFALRERDGEPVIPLDEYYKNGSLSYTDPKAEPDTAPEETKAETVTLRSDAIEHTYEVRQAYINDPNSNYYGCKVQTVQETTPDLEGIDTEVHVTPVGVMFDFSDRTLVSYMTLDRDENGDFVKAEAAPGYAPQLRIASQAADTRSYLWLGTLGTGVATRRGSVYILAEYTDPSGGVYSAGQEMKVQLYKDEERTPSYTKISIDEQYLDPDQTDPEAVKTYTIDAAQDGPTLAMAGIPIDARMFDQYGDNMYDEEGNLRVPNVEIVPVGETKEQIDDSEGKAVNALDKRFDEGTGLYYLIYGNNQLYGANDLVAGEYEVRARYDGVKEEEIGVCRLTVTKDPNKFSYLESDVSLTSDTITTPQGLLYGAKTVEENGEEIHEIRLRVPPKVLNSEGVSSEQTVTASFDLVELANQWRDASDESIQTDNDPAYDVLPDLRDPETGELMGINELRKYFDFSFEWKNGDESRTEIPGVNNTDLERTGRFTYTSAAGEGTHPDNSEGAAVEGDPMYVTVKVSRVDGEPDEVQTNQYRIYFVRDTRTLTTIKGRYLTSTPGKDVTANLEVPDQGKTVKARVDFMPYDQYDEAMNFDALQKKDGMEWEMRIDPDSMRNEKGEKVKSLEGVSLVDLNSSYVQLTEKADPCTFDVYAVYGGKSTLDPKTNNDFKQAIHVKVTKKPSVPSRVASITDSIIAIDVPNIEEPDKVNKGGPKIVVQDQYGETMDPKDYFMRWSFEQMPPDPRIRLDTATGEVSVESCAPAWDNIKMSVKLYSKVESPVGSGNWVQGVWSKDIKGTTTYEKLRVVRKANPDVTELEITTDSLSYPTQDAATRVASLEAYATTEYGVRTKLAAGDGSTWLLESVEYSDGTKASYREPILDPVTGEHLKDEYGNLRWTIPNPKQIDFETNGNTYYDVTRKVTTLEQVGGQVRFGNSITNIDWAPVAITVTCQYSNATKTVRLPIKYEDKEFSAIERRPDSVRILDSVGEVIKVPKSTEPVVKRTLDAEVKDQFGFVIYGSGAANAPCKWEILDPQKGVSIEGGNTLVVDSYAGNGSVTVKATYTQGEHSKSSEQAIGMGLEPSEPTVLTPLGIDELPEAADMEEAIIPMPGFTGPAQITKEDGTVKTLNNAVPATYTLRSKVEDGNHVHLTTQTVKWTVTQDAYNLVSIANNNKMTVQCTQAWIDAGWPETVEVKLHAYDSSNAAVNADVTLTIQKQDAFGAYAMPEIDPTAPPPTYTDNPSLKDTHLLIPNMDDYEANGPNKVSFEAKVYSQYREELPEWPAEISYLDPLTLSDTITGLKMTPTLNRKSTLEISPNVDVSIANLLILAKPNGEKATLDTSVNKYDIHLDSGASYQAGVALGEDYFNPAGEKKEDVPAWDAGEDPNIPSEAVVYTEFELEAFVHDQRGSDYEGFNVEGVYPVWGLSADCPEGVTFENPTDDVSRNNTFDADGNPYGKKVRIWVNNKVLRQNEQSKDISVLVWANGHKGEGGDFEKVQTVTLEKSESSPAYIYFKDVQGTDPEDGAGIGETIVRPGLNESAVTIPIGSLVYDSYGFVKNDVPTTITINEAALPDGVTVEPILQNEPAAEEEAAAENSEEKEAPAESPEEEEVPAVVIGQRVKRGDLVMAEFIPSTDGLGDGTLTVYTPCNLEAIEMHLQCNGVTGTKTLRLPISQQEKFAQTAVLYDDETDSPVESIEMVFNRDTDEPVLKNFYVAIFDQYGDRVSGELARTITPVWKILTPGEEKDTWVEYAEVDHEGNPIPTEERFLRYRDSAETKTLTMLANPANYQGAVQLKVECELMKDGVPIAEIPVQQMDISIRKRSSNTSSSASGAYLVTYLAGAHGTLSGNIVTETVLEGTAPKLVPDVIAAEGYAHRGWEMDGEIIDDPAQLQIYSDVVLVAQYIKLSDVAFVSGYKDSTVKPNADITRGEFTRMLVGALTNYDPETHAKYANPFEDVGEERYYRDYIAYAYFYGIVSGYEDDTFRPEAPITRAEAAGMLAKAKNFEPAVGVVEFMDLDPERWYTGYVEALGRAEILHGYEDGTFRPENHLTRAEAVTMLVRTSEAAPTERELETIRKTSKVPFKDLDRNFWAFPYILRAAGIA